MNDIVSGLKDTAMMLLGNPATLVEQILVVAVPFLIGIFALGKLGSTMGAKEEGPIRSIIVMAVGTVLVVLAVTASTLFIIPTVSPALGKWMGLIAAVVAALVVTVPVCCLVLKLNYFSAAITWALAVGIIAGLIYVSGAAYDGVIEGMGAGKQIGQRTDSIDGVIDGK